jgi:hypothetical protein
MLSAVFKSAAGHHISQDSSLDSLCTHSEMAEVLFWLAYWTKDYLQWARQNISDAQYNLTFKLVANLLNEEISDSELKFRSKEDTPSLLFYLASIFMWFLLDHASTQNALRNQASSFGQGLRCLLEALLQYRTRTSGRNNDLLKTRFANEDYFYKKGKIIKRFSEEWWDILVEDGRDIGLIAAEQGTHNLYL